MEAFLREIQTWVEFRQQTRDPSHFRQRTTDEWRALTAEADFRSTAEQTVLYCLEFDW